MVSLDDIGIERVDPITSGPYREALDRVRADIRGHRRRRVGIHLGAWLLGVVGLYTQLPYIGFTANALALPLTKLIRNRERKDEAAEEYYAQLYERNL